MGMFNLSVDSLIQNDISDFSSLDKCKFLGTSFIVIPQVALSTVVVAVTCYVKDFIALSGIDSLTEPVVFEKLVSSTMGEPKSYLVSRFESTS